MPNNTAKDDFEDFDGDSDGSLYTAFDARNGAAPDLDREEQEADSPEKLRNVSPESRRPDLNIDPAFCEPPDLKTPERLARTN
jgi:hypothetical protein